MAVTATAGSVQHQRAARRSGWRPFLIINGLLALLMIAARLYEQAFAERFGIDSASPEFARYWTSVLIGELLAIGVGTLIWWGWLVRTRCATCELQRSAGGIDAAHEEDHLKVLWGLVAAAAQTAFWMGGFWVNNDLSWHQTLVRDTAFTPTHIFIFYLAFPLGITFSVGSFLYARTRLRQVWGKGLPMSFLLLMTGFVLLMAQVAFNEWGHSLWITEEISAATFHWFFVFYAYVAGGAFFAIWAEMAGRLLELRAEARKAAVAA